MLRQTIFAILMANMMAVIPASGQTSSFEVDEERIEVLRRVSDGMNSADPAIRIATFEAAIATKDPAITHRVLEEALASPDLYLRYKAEAQLLRGKSEFILEIGSYISGDPRSKETYTRVFGSGWALIYPVYAQQSGELFKCASDTKQMNKLHERSTLDRLKNCSYSNGELRLTFKPKDNSGTSECTARLSYEPEAQAFSGTMACGHNGDASIGNWEVNLNPRL